LVYAVDWCDEAYADDAFFPTIDDDSAVGAGFFADSEIVGTDVQIGNVVSPNLLAGVFKGSTE
jgi:hypothetical protein